MKCKVGDLAVIVNAVTQKQYIGRLVKCISVFDGDAWVTEPELVNRENGWPISWYDAHLQPIRDNPGADETLSWKSLPHPSKETAA